MLNAIGARALLLALAALAALAQVRAAAPDDMRARLAKNFEGTYRFNYVFVENGIPYVDVASHLQFLDLGKNQTDAAPRIAFLNQTPKGEKRAHYSYIFYQDGDKIILREYGGNGDFRFDCIGTYQVEKKLLECVAPKAAKPARDTDSPATRKSGLFKRPTSWPAYESLNRHNLFRFYAWGFVNIQENLKLDASGKTVARETGIITALKVRDQGLSPSGGN
jgi:hypothetical protein